ncbi:MAG: alpha-galactosidase [Clostridia bacterium]|nr:alpha-galactosidase [Clostridia bacterium]
MKKLLNSNITDISLSTIFMGLMIYSAYSLWYIFNGTQSGADIHLYTVLSGMAIGWFLVMFINSALKKTNWIPKLIAFIVGNGFFQGLIWGINAKINKEYLLNDQVVIKTFTVAFSLSAILLLVAFILRAKKKQKILSLILAIVYFIISCGGVIVLNEENIKALEYKQDIKFDTMESHEIEKEEIALASQWYEDSFFGIHKKMPFTFKIDGEAFNPTQWEQHLTEEPEIGSVYEGGKTSYLVYKNKSTDLEVTVEATFFEKNATCQWTVYLKNTGKNNSGVISDFYALDFSFPTGKADLYYSMGSDTAASDFSLIKKNLNFIERKFSGVDGKPTESHLPYFNILGESYGLVLGIGWTGQWASGISAKSGETSITVKQENFEAYLLPGEEIRSPLISLSFYDDTNALKGFNLFRNWVMDSVYPENIKKNYYTVMELAGPVSSRTSDEILNILDNEIADSVYEEIDAFWMDAGWYSYNEGWYDGVGNWTVDESRYDNGISELSDYATKKGLKHTLWYEPERVYPGTQFHTVGSENEEWLISADGEDNLMWNLANEDAFEYYCDYLLNSMKENGVTIYRQDFNFAPLKYWQKADAEYYGGRTGICENHYVTNLYRYLDYLTENIDGLIIDNCASGGKRLDLEITYRSIAFWRSDYNCSYHPDLFDATQSMTYGISFWLPITGANLYMSDEYAGRSAIMPLVLMDFFSHQHPEYSLYLEQRALMGGNYYPLEFGSFDNDRMHAMEFISRDATEGTVLIYKRANVKDTEYTINFNGLKTATDYKIYDIDNPEKVYTMSGIDLMQEGLTIPLPEEGQKAIILMFEAK